MLLLRKASKNDAFILFSAICFYNAFIINLDATSYYICSALLNLIVGMSLQFINKRASLCSYALVLVNALGFYLWYNYYPPLVYDNIFMLIVILQVAFILPRGTLNGLRNYIKHIVVGLTVFNRNQSHVTMYKSNQIKKT